MDDIPACVSPVNMSQIKDIHVFQDLTFADPDYTCNCRLDLLLGMVHCNLCSQDALCFPGTKLARLRRLFLDGQLVDLHNSPALPPLLHPLV